MKKGHYVARQNAISAARTISRKLKQAGFERGNWDNHKTGFMVKTIGYSATVSITWYDSKGYYSITGDKEIRLKKEKELKEYLKSIGYKFNERGHINFEENI